MLKLKLTLFQITIRFLNKVFLRLEYDEGLVRHWVGVVLKRCETRGTIDTIGWVKALRLCCTRFLCGSPLRESPGFGVVLGPDGLPKGVPLVKYFRDGGSAQIRFALTLLGVSRILPGTKLPDLSTITDPGKGHMSSRMRDDLVRVVRFLGWRVPQPTWTECHISTKAGPNAQALVGSIEDAHLLTDLQISYLQILGGGAVVRLIQTIRSCLSPLSWLGALTLKVKGKEKKLLPKGRQGKLSLVKDKEAKCRIVAILDYWTQSVLHPLHESLMALLRSIPGDCTFDQGSFRTHLPRKGPYYSLDLSAATDRFPVDIQVLVLGLLISPEFAAAWRALLLDRDYFLSWGPLGRVVRYAVGQPMGAYSSWAMFAVSHHVIVRVAALRAGKPITWNRYALLGDDIVLTDAAVVAEYRAILAEIGVDVSEPKTHESQDTYEFAKRWIHKGTEVTGAPFGSLFEAVRFRKDVSGGLLTKAISYISFYGVAVWFRELEVRWLPRSLHLASRALFAEFFALLGASAASRLAEKTWRFYLLPSREDSRSFQAFKRVKLGEILISGILGCFSWSRTLKINTLGVLLVESKARVLESAIKKQVQRLFDFQVEAKKYLSLFPEGLDGQSVLLALPPFAVLRSHIRDLQMEYEKVRVVRESEAPARWLAIEVRLVLDPYAAISTRQSKVVASNKATVLNHLVAMCRGIEYIRDIAKGPISEESLIDLINNHHVVPTRGDRRRKGKRGGVSSKGKSSA